MIIGAGAAGQMLIKEIQNASKLKTKVCCVIDDNPTYYNRKSGDTEYVEGGSTTMRPNFT